MIQDGSSIFTADQLRAARGLLDWPQSYLAKRAGLSLPTVKRAEGYHRIRASDEARRKIREALEAAGIVFLDENGGGVGVRFRKPNRRK